MFAASKGRGRKIALPRHLGQEVGNAIFGNER